MLWRLILADFAGFLSNLRWKKNVLGLPKTSCAFTLPPGILTDRKRRDQHRPPARFRRTWPGKLHAHTLSVVLAAAGPQRLHPRARRPGKLCRNYWLPIYACVRRQGHSPHDAQTRTQEFFTRLLEHNYLASVDREKGRFRSFLLASLKHFLANEWDKAKAQKRGGRNVIISIDAAAAENSVSLEPADLVTAEKIF